MITPIAPTSLLLGLPNLSTSGQSPLPWPVGSFVPAQVLAQPSGEFATLLIGNYRLRAKVPPNLPAGALWLELVSRDDPPRFRIVPQEEIRARIAELLADRATESPETKGSGERAHPAAHPLQEQGWQVQSHPDGSRHILMDPDDGSPRGILWTSGDGEGFELHGRIDLDRLGAIYFRLASSGDAPGLTLACARRDSLSLLKPALMEWIEDVRARSPFARHLHSRIELVDTPPSWSGIETTV